MKNLYQKCEKIKLFFKNQATLISTLLILILSQNPASAEEFNLSNQLLREQQKLLDMEKVNRELDDFKEWQKTAEIENKSTGVRDDGGEGGCFEIQKINLEGNSVLSKTDILQITQEYQDTCISNKHITEIIVKFSAIYMNLGYITTQVYVKKQNLKSGILTLSVVEGKVEEVTFGKEATADKVTKYFITPLSKGDILNIKAVDQTTENLNYIPSYKYKTNIEAGSKPGLSRINITGERKFPISPYIETDTFGQQYTGHNRYTVGLKFDNPLKLGDSLNLKYISTRGFFNSDSLRDPFNDVNDGRYSKSYIGSWSMPIKWARIGINSSYSTYLTTIQGQIQTFQSSGTLKNNSFFINGIVFRNKSVKTSLFSNLNILDSKSYINDTLSNVQSRTLANVELGITNNLYTKYGSFFHKFTYIRGLTSFGSKVDTVNATTHAQFNAVKFYGLYNIKTKGILPFTFSNTIDGQYAWTDVYSQNQFVLGGFYSVRGFRDVNIYGSSGILTRNDIDFVLADYIKPTNKFTKMLTNSGNGGLSVGIFYDIGVASSHAPNNTTAAGTGAGTLSSGNYGVLSGAGYKLGYISKYFQTSLTVAHSLKYPDYLAASVKANDGQVIYLTIRGVI